MSAADVYPVALAYEVMRDAGWQPELGYWWLTGTPMPRPLPMTEGEERIHAQLGEPVQWPPEADPPRRPVRHLLACFADGPIACVCPLNDNTEPF